MKSSSLMEFPFSPHTSFSDANMVFFISVRTNFRTSFHLGTSTDDSKQFIVGSKNVAFLISKFMLHHLIHSFRDYFQWFHVLADCFYHKSHRFLLHCQKCFHFLGRICRGMGSYTSIKLNLFIQIQTRTFIQRVSISNGMMPLISLHSHLG